MYIPYFRSGSYHIRTSLPTEKQQVLLNHVSHSGVLLEPNTAGQVALPTTTTTVQAETSPQASTEKKATLSKMLKNVATPSISGKPIKIIL